ncbi:MAG TPA: T9SS type A sorting domain-containing protein [Chitinophagales bacterium]|nr:T9SS type A sorting domain-containing protein [Chitinophagales bacterium]
MKKISILIFISAFLSLQLLAQKPYPHPLDPTLTHTGFNINMGTNPPGTFDFYPDKDIKLLPNPFNETAHLLINLPQKEFTLTVFDYSGKKMQTSSTKDGTFIIDGKNLPEGNYLYLLLSKDGKVKYTGKFEISR